MVRIPIKQYVFTTPQKMLLGAKVLFFLAVVAWTLTKGYSSLTTIAMVTLATFLVLLFLYLVFAKKTHSMEKRLALCGGNTVLISGLIILVLRWTH